MDLEEEITQLIVSRMKEDTSLTVNKVILILQRLYKQSLQK